MTLTNPSAMIYYSCQAVQRAITVIGSLSDGTLLYENLPHFFPVKWEKWPEASPFHRSRIKQSRVIQRSAPEWETKTEIIFWTCFGEAGVPHSLRHFYFKIERGKIRHRLKRVKSLCQILSLDGLNTKRRFTVSRYQWGQYNDLLPETVEKAKKRRTHQKRVR